MAGEILDDYRPHSGDLLPAIKAGMVFASFDLGDRESDASDAFWRITKTPVTGDEWLECHAWNSSGDVLPHPYHMYWTDFVDMWSRGAILHIADSLPLWPPLVECPECQRRYLLKDNEYLCEACRGV